MEIIILEQVEKFLESLDDKVNSRAHLSIEILEKFGHLVRFPVSKKISKDIFELRVQGKPNIRIFYTFKQRKAILLYGFVKKTQKIPKVHIKNVTNLLKGLT